MLLFLIKQGSCPSKLHMKQAEYQAQFGIWAVMASQMIISADVRTVQTTQPACFKLLLNKEILAVSQDPAAHSPSVVLSQTVVVGKAGHNETKILVTAQVRTRKRSINRWHAYIHLTDASRSLL